VTAALDTATATKALRRSERLSTARTIAIGAVVVYAVQAIFFPTPTGQLLKGIIIGGLTALIAIGISLVYRSNRIINFAQADLGAVPAAFTVMLISSAGLPLLIGLPIGLVTAIAVGAIVEFLIIRRASDSRAPPADRRRDDGAP
jgi:branched-chain amino acid transport system permease protein